jgi:SAM-dependent methyltransferase
MKLKHDIENDLEHTIPPPGGPDSQWLFRAMTERSLAWVEPGPGRCVVDLASGMGQDTLSLAAWLTQAGGAGAGVPHHPNGRRTAQGNLARTAEPSLVIGIEPSNRMIRFGQHLQRHPHAGGAAVSAKPPGGADGARFVRGLGEEIPLRSASVDAVLCKGALDHFMDPALTVGEIGRVLKPGGRAVIALANYGSLSCRLGRRFDRGRRRAADAGHPYYEPPPDHMTRFTYGSIVALAAPPLRVRRVEGLSLLWGFPPWGRLLNRLPAPLQSGLLRLAHAVARWRPAWADVVLLVAEKAHAPGAAS